MPTRILGRGSLTGTSELCYLVLGAPQHRNIFTNIAEFLADSHGEVTRDLCNLSISCGFLHFWTRIFSQVDTPSLGNSDITPVSILSSEAPPDDVGYS